MYMDSTSQFMVTLGVGIVLFGGNVIVGLIAYATRQMLEAVKAEFGGIKVEIARVSECLAHVEQSQYEDTRNLEDWKLKYAEAHGPLVSRVAAIESALSNKVDSMGLDVRTLLIQLPLLTQKVDNLDKRLAEFERALRETRGEMS